MAPLSPAKKEPTTGANKPANWIQHPTPATSELRIFFAICAMATAFPFLVQMNIAHCLWPHLGQRREKWSNATPMKSPINPPITPHQPINPASSVAANSYLEGGNRGSIGGLDKSTSTPSTIMCPKHNLQMIEPAIANPAGVTKAPGESAKNWF
ncbi:hypothetical protein [Prosthecobacter sp.]|jgi:hypothetical protein|uniref:hypothetical protein n=1 Tax=Prosthecobacter sp. TaxID=1965333 RepID=UPI0037C9D16C